MNIMYKCNNFDRSKYRLSNLDIIIIVIIIIIIIMTITTTSPCLNLLEMILQLRH